MTPSPIVVADLLSCIKLNFGSIGDANHGISVVKMFDKTIYSCGIFDIAQKVKKTDNVTRDRGTICEGDFLQIDKFFRGGGGCGHLRSKENYG